MTNRAYHVAVAVILFVALVFGVFLYETLHRIDSNSSTTAKTVAAIQCSDRLIAEFASATGDAFAAPPASAGSIGTLTPQRQKAVDDILAAAQRLRHSGTTCAP